jgi:two-component system, NarL family, nitrate/nitrite response regulator NarL
MQNLSTYRMLIVDDYSVHRAGLWTIASILSGFEVCGFAENQTDAVAKVKELKPDLASVDLSCRPGAQADCIRAIHRVNPELPILALGAEEGSGDEDTWLNAGASYVVRKDAAVASIAKGLLEVMKANGDRCRRDRDSNLASPGRWRTGRNTTRRTRSASFPRASWKCSTCWAAANPQKKPPNLLNVSEKTIESHRESIKSKLDIDNFTKFMRHAVQWHLLRTQPEPVRRLKGSTPKTVPHTRAGY